MYVLSVCTYNGLHVYATVWKNAGTCVYDLCILVILEFCLQLSCARLVGGLCACVFGDCSHVETHEPTLVLLPLNLTYGYDLHVHIHSLHMYMYT